MEGDPPPESLSEYCLKLGLQVRDNNEGTKMAVSDAAAAAVGEKSAEEILEPELEEGMKGNYDCKNCNKGFTSARQFTKHKCSSKVAEESSPTKKRIRKTKKRYGGVKITKSPTVEKELEGPEAPAETVTEPTSQAQADEACPSVGHLADHTYIRDENGVVVEDTSNVVLKKTDKNTIQCELCNMLATSETLPGTEGPTQETPCQKCTELAAKSNQVPISEEASGSELVSEIKPQSAKRKRSTVKKPEELCPHCKKAFSYGKCLVKHLKVCKKNKDNNSAEILCESCSIAAEAKPDDPNEDAAQKPPCEKCKALAALNKDAAGSDGEIISEDRPQVGIKRKYTFRKPEEFCPHCKKSFHSEKRLVRHMKVCGKDLVCEFCGEDFNTGAHNAYSKYEEHYYTHVEQKPFQCTVCSKGFVRKQELNKHQVIHTTEYAPQECLQCGSVFASVELLRKHTRKHERPSWSCPKCSRQFVRQALFNQHVLICQKEIACEICGKVFQCLTKNIKYRYQEHMFIHTGEKPYKCQFCERAFRDRSTRKKHERTHTGEKPYQCTMCEKAFSQLKLLRNHIFTHTGEKPFGCELCDLRFAKQCNLKYHMRVHTKEKPYTCHLCNKSFTQSGTYYKHMRRHESNQTAAAAPATPASNETKSNGQDTSTAAQEEVAADANSVNTVLIQEIPIAGDEITIIVSEGTNGTTSMETINVDQISSILASCS